uniref:Lipase domain-containing protein n=1 Tax=Steinernema glaseri TaxID=37863 RepID=A0A1I7XYD3_9BILA
MRIGREMAQWDSDDLENFAIPSSACSDCKEISSIRFPKKNNVTFIVHGFLMTQPWVGEMTESILELNPNETVIEVDWTPGSVLGSLGAVLKTIALGGFPYYTQATNTRLVGRAIAMAEIGRASC